MFESGVRDEISCVGKKDVITSLCWVANVIIKADHFVEQNTSIGFRYDKNNIIKMAGM